MEAKSFSSANLLDNFAVLCSLLIKCIKMTMMNSSTYPSSCQYNESTCYFIDSKNNCLSDDMVLQMILQYVVPTYYEWICIVLYVIVFLVGTIGNLLVIIVIQRNRSMRYSRWTNRRVIRLVWSLWCCSNWSRCSCAISRTVTNMFIMNLAAADLLVLVFCLPATVIQDVTKTWFFGLILCKFVNYIQVSAQRR